MHPDSYVVPQVNANGTISTAAGTLEDMDSPLMPFARDNAGGMHTARTVRTTSSLGYVYPELHHPDLTPAELATKVSELVEDLYGNRDLWGPSEDP